MLPSSVGIFDANTSGREKNQFPPRRTHKLEASASLGPVPWAHRRRVSLFWQWLGGLFVCLFVWASFLVKPFVFLSVWESPRVRNDLSDPNFSALLHLSVGISCLSPEHGQSPRVPHRRGLIGPLRSGKTLVYLPFSAPVSPSRRFCCGCLHPRPQRRAELVSGPF